MFFTYILKSEKDDSYYVGSTNDVESRLVRHNEGREKYTSKHIPYKLVYTKSFDTRSEAVRYEYYIKKQKSKKFIENMIAQNV